MGQIKKLSPPEVHALAVCVLMDVFQYADHQAAAFAEELIAAASDPAYHDTIHAIIHRGIDGHRQWQAGNHDELRQSIEGIFREVGA